MSPQLGCTRKPLSARRPFGLPVGLFYIDGFGTGLGHFLELRLILENRPGVTDNLVVQVLPRIEHIVPVIVQIVGVVVAVLEIVYSVVVGIRLVGIGLVRLVARV